MGSEMCIRDSNPLCSPWIHSHQTPAESDRLLSRCVVARRPSGPSGSSGRWKLPRRPDNPPRVDWGPRHVAANTRVDYVIQSIFDRAQSRHASNLHDCRYASRREHLSDNTFHAETKPWRDSQLFGRGGHRCAEAPIKMVRPEQAVGVNKTPVGVNRSKAVSPARAALFELCIPDLELSPYCII